MQYTFQGSITLRDISHAQFLTIYAHLLSALGSDTMKALLTGSALHQRISLNIAPLFRREVIAVHRSGVTIDWDDELTSFGPPFYEKEGEPVWELIEIVPR